MRPCLVRISSGGRRGWVLAPTSTFSIGAGAEADLLVNHPSLDGKRLVARRGRFNAPAEPTQGTQIARRGRSLETASFRIDLYPFPLLPPAALLILLVLLSLTGPGGDKKAAPPSQDWTPVLLPSFEPKGWCSADRSHPAGVRFVLPFSEKTGARVGFVLGGVDKGEVSVKAGGESLAGPYPLPEGWGEQRVIELPPDPGAPGGLRFLEFSFHPPQGPGPATSWCVKDVRVLPGGRDASLAGRSKDESISPGTGEGEDRAGISRRYSALPPGKSLERTRVEGWMSEALASDIIRLRALAASGKRDAAARLKQEIRAWVPPAWGEGQRILHERGGP